MLCFYSKILLKYLNNSIGLASKQRLIIIDDQLAIKPQVCDHIGFVESEDGDNDNNVGYENVQTKRGILLDFFQVNCIDHDITDKTAQSTPVCRFLNVQLVGVKSAYGTQGNRATILLENPKGEFMLDQHQLRDQVRLQITYCDNSVIS